MSLDELKIIEKERGAVYGPVRRNHENIGMAWAGLIRQSGWDPEGFDPLSADLVLLMMATLKQIRAATPVPYHADNFKDALNYTRYAERIQREDAPHTLKEVEAATF